MFHLPFILVLDSVGYHNVRLDIQQSREFDSCKNQNLYSGFRHIGKSESVRT